MPIPLPEPGLVINYAYLWHHEHAAGADEGRKDRPAVIVLAVERPADRAVEVIVLPITHRKPAPADTGVEIPSGIKGHMGLDDSPSWVIVAEGNEFEWPGFDLRPRRGGSYSFGFLPPRFFTKIQTAFVAYHSRRKARISPRR